MKIHPKAKQWVAVAEFIGFPIVVSVLLNVSAGPRAYWQAGVFALVCVACVLPMLFYFLEHPALFKRRISFGPGAEHQTSQKLIVSLLLLLYAALYVVAGLDHRFSWSNIPVLVVLVGDLVFGGGLVLIFLVFRANSFAAATVTVEAEQTVIATGPYALVRHPMYSGMLAMFLGLPLALGSWWGLFTFLPLLVVTIWRLEDEERYLSNHLAGYRDYCANVTHRLFPSIW
ncbi:MAG TPA: isoprenylcysteine carboxylmethyltransferase family protein [Ktedonobacteraceae bacterium]|nr:isoprenylcysteine carboxylmethyltransferase family protein [Ktedonobacteraceae bacterium]